MFKDRISPVSKFTRGALPFVIAASGAIEALAQNPTPTPGPDEGDRVASVSTPDEPSGLEVGFAPTGIPREENWGNAVEFLDDQDFLKRYVWQPEDEVQLVRTGRGAENAVSEHWTLSVTRDGITRDNLPVIEQHYGGYVRPLDITERENAFNANRHSYDMNAIYLGQGEQTIDVNGEPAQFRFLIVALPSENDPNETLVLRIMASEDLFVGVLTEEGDIRATRTPEAFDRVSEIATPGDEVYLTLFEHYSKAELDEVFGDDCNRVCEVTKGYVMNSEYSTDPRELFNYWQTGQEEGLIREENHLITASPLSKVIATPPPGTVVRLNQ